MKKIISVVLVAVLAFSLVACNNEDEKDNSATKNEPSTLELNIEELKYNWTSGVLRFADGKQTALPCSLEQFFKETGVSLNGVDVDKQTLEAGASKTLYLVGNGVQISVTCENSSEKSIKLTEAIIKGYSFNNTNNQNKNIKYAGTLTVGVGKADVIEALGEPEKIVSETLYYYNGRNDNRQKVELRINFNSNDIVNSVAFEIKD